MYIFLIQLPFKSVKKGKESKYACIQSFYNYIVTVALSLCVCVCVCVCVYSNYNLGSPIVSLKNFL